VIVIDASILTGVFFEEAAAGSALTEIEAEGSGVSAAAGSRGLVAPDFITLELANAVISNRRRVARREVAAGGKGRSDRLDSMPAGLLADEIRRRLAMVDLVLEPAITERRFARALQIAELHRLSMYDACYIALAEELRATLATLDAAMQIAARELGIPVLPALGKQDAGARRN
jgi:predicted nucleic acid-binding protein